MLPSDVAATVRKPHVAIAVLASMCQGQASEAIAWPAGLGALRYSEAVAVLEVIS